ncbi:hypothetical protein O0L34_g18653 [Tuta absoluta]|nr:hypothetical protein O0L34_g18653 [Tuta absoluta]
MYVPPFSLVLQEPEVIVNPETEVSFLQPEEPNIYCTNENKRPVNAEIVRTKATVHRQESPQSDARPNKKPRSTKPSSGSKKKNKEEIMDWTMWESDSGSNTDKSAGHKTQENPGNISFSKLFFKNSNFSTKVETGIR